MDQQPRRPAIAPGYQDILGQDQACQGLWAALQAERLHHCYLFEGPLGVGKATVALRLAMAANCEAAAEPGARPPCTRCPSCRSIGAGRHPDVIELVPDPKKASGTITVDQVRDVIRRLSLHRHSARRRFVIVDPAELLRVEATNALLKSLEEPPLGTGFVLVTSRVASLLPTVISRSLRVRFRAVALDELAPWLAARGLADPERLARLALGSPGAALRLGDGRLVALQAARGELLTALAGGPAELLGYAERSATGKRVDWEPRLELCLELLELLLRDATCCASGRDELVLDPDQLEMARSWAERLWPTGFQRIELALEQARQRLRLNVSPRLVLEALLSRVAAELR